MWCDYIERPFSTPMRPFRNSDVEVTQHWYFAAPGAQQLPTVTPLNVAGWLNSLAVKTGVGAIQGAPTTLEKPTVYDPPPPGDHYHGELSDFRTGCFYDPAGPVLARNDNGIPAECQPPRGGINVSGTGLGAYLVNVNISGGYEPAPFSLQGCNNALPQNPWELAWHVYNGFLFGVFPTMKIPSLVAGRRYRIRSAQMGTAYVKMSVFADTCFFPPYQVDIAGPGPWVYDDVLPAPYSVLYVQWDNSGAGGGAPANGPLILFVEDLGV